MGKLAGKAKEAAGSLLGKDDLARAGRLHQAQSEAEVDASRREAEAEQRRAEAELEAAKARPSSSGNGCRPSSRPRSAKPQWSATGSRRSRLRR